jgi:hypothetical protein
MMSASHRRTASAQETAGGRHVVGGGWPPSARAPRPRAGGGRLGGPCGTPLVVAASPARVNAHMRPWTRAGARGPFRPATWRPLVGLRRVSWPELPGWPMVRPVFIFSAPVQRPEAGPHPVLHVFTGYRRPPPPVSYGALFMCTHCP